MLCSCMFYILYCYYILELNIYILCVHGHSLSQKKHIPILSVIYCIIIQLAISHMYNISVSLIVKSG